VRRDPGRIGAVVITAGQRPEPDAPVLTEAEWHLYLTADDKSRGQILTGCAAWLSAQKARVTA
jgi:hypothetical protein